jgi:hypothetical protein
VVIFLLKCNFNSFTKFLEVAVAVHVGALLHELFLRRTLCTISLCCALVDTTSNGRVNMTLIMAAAIDMSNSVAGLRCGFVVGAVAEVLGHELGEFLVVPEASMEYV